MKNAINRGVFGFIGGAGWLFGISVLMSAESAFHEQTALLAILTGTVAGGIYQILKRLDSD